MAAYGTKDVQNILDNFAKGRDVMNGMTVEILPQENNVDALLLLRTFNGEKTADDLLPLAQAFCRNKTIRIVSGTKELYKVQFDGTAPMQNVFAKDPWVLDLVLNCAYALMLKKLTPPSVVLDEQAAAENTES